MDRALEGPGSLQRLQREFRLPTHMGKSVVQMSTFNQINPTQVFQRFVLILVLNFLYLKSLEDLSVLHDFG